MSMRSLVAGARAAVRASEPAVLAKAPTIGAPIRAPQPPLLTTAPAMGASCRAGQTAVLPRAQAMAAPLRAAETNVLTRSPAMGAPLRAAEPWASKAPGMGASIRADLNINVGISFAANAAASTTVAAGRVLTPRTAARVWTDRAGVKKPFGARCLSTATKVKPPPTDSGIWDYILVASAIGGAAVIYFLTKIEHVDDVHEGELPESIDWSLALNFPFVADPMYNTNCGSCWAVTGVKSIEAYIAIKEGILFPNLSIQQVIDCVAINGCGGCSLNRLYNYSATTGLTTEQFYPGVVHPDPPARGRSFLEGLLKGYCNMQGKPPVVRIRGYERIRPTEDSLMIALQSGPVAVLITTSGAFNKYTAGTILELHECPPSAKPNHAVLVVGYDTTKEGVKYWKIMNTWGPGWGKGGYCLFRRVGAGEGVGGIRA